MDATQKRNIFADRLKLVAKHRDVTQADLVRELGISRPKASHWWNGTHVPKHQDLKRLAAFLAVPWRYLTGESDSMSVLDEFTSLREQGPGYRTEFGLGNEAPPSLTVHWKGLRRDVVFSLNQSKQLEIINQALADIDREWKQRRAMAERLRGNQTKTESLASQRRDSRTDAVARNLRQRLHDAIISIKPTANEHDSPFETTVQFLNMEKLLQELQNQGPDRLNSPMEEQRHQEAFDVLRKELIENGLLTPDGKAIPNPLPPSKPGAPSGHTAGQTPDAPPASSAQ